MTTRALCETCLWWYQQNSWLKSNNFGSCHVKGPTYSDLGGEWPITHASDFCGEHSARTSKPKEPEDWEFNKKVKRPKEPNNVVFSGSKIPRG
jgi:hypothetical protein